MFRTCNDAVSVSYKFMNGPKAFLRSHRLVFFRATRKEQFFVSLDKRLVLSELNRGGEKFDWSCCLSRVNALSVCGTRS